MRLVTPAGVRYVEPSSRETRNRGAAPYADRFHEGAGGRVDHGRRERPADHRRDLHRFLRRFRRARDHVPRTATRDDQCLPHGWRHDGCDPLLCRGKSAQDACQGRHRPDRDHLRAGQCDEPDLRRAVLHGWAYADAPRPRDAHRQVDLLRRVR